MARAGAASYYRLRRVVTRAADRLTEWCDRHVRPAYAIRPAWLQERVRRWLLVVGSLARIVALLPRLDATLLVGPSWRVVYVGDRTLFPELVRALFPESVETEALPRVAAWRLRVTVPALLARADLVVCGLPAMWPARWRPDAAWRAEAPVMVEMVAALDGSSFADWLRRRPRTLRRTIAAAEAVGFSLRTTHDFESLVQFHEELYLPHIRRRHSDLALTTTAEAQWRDWVAGTGELLLLDLGGRSVAGMTVAYHGPVVFLGEEGISDEIAGSPPGRRAQVALKMHAIARAMARGQERLSIGRTLARRAHQGFVHKQRWGGRPMLPDRSAYPTWTLLADRLPPSLSARLAALALLDRSDLTRTILPPGGTPRLPDEARPLSP